MAGVFEKMVEKITDENVDSSFMDILFLTYRSFATPEVFFDHLIARFNCELPSNPTQEDITFFHKMKLPTQHSVLKALMWWVERHWHDFATNSIMRSDLDEFAKELEGCGNKDFAKKAWELQSSIDVQSEKFQNMINSKNDGTRKGKSIESLLENIEANELAEQMCLHNFNLFKDIHPIEYLNQIWTVKAKDEDITTPSLDYFIHRFDLESYWVATEIVTVKDLKKRVKIIKKWIMVAKVCLTSSGTNEKDYQSHTKILGCSCKPKFFFRLCHHSRPQFIPSSTPKKDMGPA